MSAIPLILELFILIICGQTLANLNNTRSAIMTTLSNDPKDIHFLVYTQRSPNTSKTLEIGSPASLKKSKLRPGPMLLLADGFLSYNQGAGVLKDAYIAAGRASTIIVDWSKLSGSRLPTPLSFASYLEVLKNVNKVGKKGAQLIRFLTKAGIVRGPRDVRCIGHSLGAHVCGSIGLLTRNLMGKKVGRVTGLDPAGPFYKLLKEDKLNKNDATFVDAIHTDIDAFGSPDRFGHADFYVNGGLGKDQPGCEGLDFFFTIECGHELALYFFANTIAGARYDGCRCETSDDKVSLPCGEPNVCRSPALVGEHCPSRARGKYYVEVEDDQFPAPYSTLFNAIHAVENPVETLTQLVNNILQGVVEECV